MAQGDTARNIVVIILVAIFLQTFGIVDLKSVVPGQEGTTDGGTTLTGICSDPSNTMTIGPQFVRWSTTAATGENVGYWKNGVYQGSKSDSATVTVANEDEIALLYGLDSTTRYMNYVTFTAPCKPFSSAEMDGLSNELMTADLDFTVKAFNGDDGLLNAAGVNESIGSGEEGRWDIEIEGTSEQAISPHGLIWLIVGYEKNNFTSGDMTLDGKQPNGVVPSYFTTVNFMNYKVFKVDGCPVKQGNKICDLDLGTLVVKAKDGQNPAASGDSNLGSFVNITVLNEDYDLDTNTNAIMGGGTPVIEDNDGTRSGHISDGITLYVS